MPERILNVEPEAYSTEAREIITSVATLDEIALSREALIASIHQYDGLIVRLGHTIDRTVLQHAHRLKFIATAVTGLNHIDCEEAAKRQIAVLSLKGERAFLDTISATAEHTWGLILALLRALPSAAEHVKQFGWNRNLFKGQELCGRTLGIVGYGRLGTKVAHYANAFGMRVLACDPAVSSGPAEVKFVSFEDVLTQADIVSLHVPYNQTTVHLIGQRELALMKPGAYLVNTSRGEILDEDALLHALKNGHLAGAALDVLSGETCTQAEWMKRHPLISYAREHAHIIITPHIGGATWDSMAKTEIFLAQKIKKFLVKRVVVQ